MGTLKIELDLPEFKDKLEVSIVVKKDGTIVPPSIKKDESLADPNTVNPSNPIIPNIRDPYPWEKKLEIGDDPSTIVGPYCNTSTDLSQDGNVNVSNSNVVDSMVNGQW